MRVPQNQIDLLQAIAQVNENIVGILSAGSSMLSYTEFTYSDIHVEPDKVACTVTNSGERDGAEVVQLYVGMKDSGIFRPVKELKGFRKIFISAYGRSQRGRYTSAGGNTCGWNNI